MAESSIEAKVEILLKDTIQNLGYELYDVIYIKEGKDYYLRIVIDNDKGINIEDCEKVNDSINDILDEADYIKEQYFLEVSSPGIERMLRKKEHFIKQIGNKVLLKLFKPINEKRELKGILKNYTDNELIIESENFNQNEIEAKEIVVEIKNIALAKTVFDW